MPTDPARVRAVTPATEKCPVWEFHKVYSDDKTRQWVDQGCRSAGIGCLECKRPVIDAVLAELKPIQERVAEFARDPLAVRVSSRTAASAPATWPRRPSWRFATPWV